MLLVRHRAGDQHRTSWRRCVPSAAGPQGLFPDLRERAHEGREPHSVLLRSGPPDASFDAKDCVVRFFTCHVYDPPCTHGYVDNPLDW